ncbi:MAG: multicopper oxidase domain-containing protein [Flavobacteriales bacterium]|nr:multicopper oxidase domain-containing protein [Flavobacteriales bacterium]
MKHTIKMKHTLVCGLFTHAAVSLAQNPLPIPDTLSGADINLVIQEGTYEFHAGEVVNTYGYNGDLLGPTLILQQGMPVTLNVSNTLPDLTTTHWHGLHVSAENDGGPHSLIAPGTTWSPSFTVLDKASTFWYHPHGHGLTDFQVSMGLAGMIIVRDAEEAALQLPREYGVDDIPLVLQTKAIVGGQIMLHTGLDSVVLANGVRDAYKELPAQVVRLRCLNGASERTFLLGFSNGMSFHVIGTDGGLLAAPVSLTRLRLMPGERVELLVDLVGMTGQAFQLMSYGAELPDGIIGSAQVSMGGATLDGYEDNALNGANFPLVSFTVGSATVDPVTILPSALATVVPYLEANATVTRTFTLAPEVMGPLGAIEGPFEINGNLFDMDMINETIQLGATEIWEFQNNTGVTHPIHIHDIQFNILERDGVAPDPWESGWKDVVMVPGLQGSVRVITRFDDFADPEMPYMYHCHLLMHEDEGMMGQFLVVDPNGIGEAGRLASIDLWPNPANDALWAQWPGQVITQVMVLDASGRTVATAFANTANERARINTSALNPGSYTVLLANRTGNNTRGRFIIAR